MEDRQSCSICYSPLDIEIVIIIGVKTGTRETEEKISACLRKGCYV